MAIAAMREAAAIFQEVYLEMANELIENLAMNTADKFGGHQSKIIPIRFAKIPSMNQNWKVERI